MAGADGVAAHFAEDLEAPFPHALRHGRANAAAVMVHADAIHFYAVAVQQEPLVGVEHHLAVAGDSLVLVDDHILLFHRAAHRVQRRSAGDHNAGFETLICWANSYSPCAAMVCEASPDAARLASPLASAVTKVHAAAPVPSFRIRVFT